MDQVKSLMADQENKYQSMFNQMYQQIMAIQMSPEQMALMQQMSMETEFEGADDLPGDS